MATPAGPQWYWWTLALCQGALNAAGGKARSVEASVHAPVGRLVPNTIFLNWHVLSYNKGALEDVLAKNSAAKGSDMASVEERLARLEREIEELKKARKGEQSSKGGNWVSKITGTFKDDPDFDEILRLGREERKADILNDE